MASWIGAMTLWAAPALAVEDYQSCIALIERDPPRALTEALQWRDLGGGRAARHCVALAHVGNGDFRLAAARLTELIDEIAPQSADAAAEVAAQAAAVWLQAREDTKAVPLLRRAIALRPGDARLHLDLAHVLAAEGALDEAEVEADRALALDDLSADAYALQAMIRRERKDFAASEEALANALALDPDQPMARLEQALAQARGGDRDGARRDLNDLIAEDPESDLAETARRYLQQLDVR